jgi:hypothetical protein
MPRDAILLSDVGVPILTVVCEPCGRRERFDVESLKRQHGGDVKMPDLLAALVADCPKARSFSIYTRCKAVYERRGERDPLCLVVHVFGCWTSGKKWRQTY